MNYYNLEKNFHKINYTNYNKASLIFFVALSKREMQKSKLSEEKSEYKDK